MTGLFSGDPVRKLYGLTGVLGVIGFAWFFWSGGIRIALAFGLGALCSAGNLWSFEHLSRIIAPGEDSRKPWQAGTYFIRYVLLLGIGYVIVKTLNVSPFAVVLGLLASTAAVLLSLILELILSFSGRTKTP